MKVPEFGNLYLVGGTSLALQLGHRMSVDIDLFGRINLSEFEISELIKGFGKTTLINKSKNISIYSIEGIKVDTLTNGLMTPCCRKDYAWQEKGILPP